MSDVNHFFSLSANFHFELSTILNNPRLVSYIVFCGKMSFHAKTFCRSRALSDCEELNVRKKKTIGDNKYSFFFSSNEWWYTFGLSILDNLNDGPLRATQQKINREKRTKESEISRNEGGGGWHKLESKVRENIYIYIYQEESWERMHVFFLV